MSDRKYIQNTVILFVSMALTKVIGALFKIPLANLLGGTGMGYFSTAYGLYSPVFALTAAGVPTVITRITARSMAAGDECAAVGIKRIAMGLFSCVGLTGTLVVALFAEPFANSIACSPKSALAIVCISPAVFLCCIASVIRGYYEGLSNVVPSAAAAAAEAVSRAIFGLSMAYAVVFYANSCFYNGRQVFGEICSTAEQAYDTALPYAAAGAVLAVSISELCGLITLLVTDRRHSKCQKPYPPLKCSKKQVCLMLLRETAPIAGSALVMNCVSFVDLLTVTRTLSVSAAENADYFSRRFSSALGAAGGLEGLPNFMYGSYTGIAMSLFMLIPSFAGMTEKTAIPEITAAWTRGDNRALSKAMFTLFRASATIAAPACFGAAALAEPIMSMLYSSRAAEVSVCLDSFVILCLGGIFMTAASAMFGVFQAVNKAHIPLVLMIISVAVKLTLNPLLMLIPSLNIAGAAAASAVGYVIMAVGGYIMLKRTVTAEVRLFRAILPPAIFGMLCGAAAHFTHITLGADLNQVADVLLSILSGGFVYLILTIFNSLFCRSDTITWKMQKIFQKPLAKSKKIG